MAHLAALKQSSGTHETFELKQKQQTTAPSSTSNLESKLYSVTINESPSDNSTTILISIRAMTKIIAVKFNSIIGIKTSGM